MKVWFVTFLSDLLSLFVCTLIRLYSHKAEMIQTNSFNKLFFCMLFISLFSSQLLADNNKVVTENEKYFNVIVTSYSRNTINAKGGGFIIERSVLNEESHYYLVTSRHLLLGADHGEYTLNGKDTFQIESLAAEDPLGDIIIFHIKRPNININPLFLADKLMSDNEKIVAGESLSTKEPRILETVVTRAASINVFGDLGFFRTTPTVTYTGFPVLNNQSEVIGVATLSWVDGNQEY